MKVMVVKRVMVVDNSDGRQRCPQVRGPDKGGSTVLGYSLCYYDLHVHCVVKLLKRRMSHRSAKMNY